jgi:hypothetical protein
MQEKHVDFTVIFASFLLNISWFQQLRVLLYSNQYIALIQ